MGQLDLAQNYQIHQLSQIAVTDHLEGRWISLANRPHEISCYHFSAVPKPSHLMLGEINKESSAWMWKVFEEYADWLNDAEQDSHEHAGVLSMIIYDYFRKRAESWETCELDLQKDELFRDTAH